MSRYVGMLRVKNEARWLRYAVESLRFCEAVYIFDDHSNDDTPALARSLGCHVVESKFEGFNEIRDKNFILEHVQNAGHGFDDTYVVHIDGDEELEKGARDKLEFIVAVSAPMALSLQVLYLWDMPNLVRVDGVYGNFFRPSVMKMPAAPVSFASATHNVANLHCSNVIADYLPYVVKTPIRLWHYGYIHKADRIRKYEWYNSIDPNNEFEDCYRHTVIGDVLPANHVGIHGGPLQVQRRID